MKNIPISYIEFCAQNLEAIKKFYGELFGWQFTDYGPAYCSFAGAGVDGGFRQTEEPVTNGVLVVLYFEDLEAIKSAIATAGGIIAREIFSFPGGRRFHFRDPDGNELAVWSDT